MIKTNNQVIGFIVLVLLSCILSVFVLSDQIFNREVGATADYWYNTNWTYAQNITINSSYIDSDLTDFPILVNLSSTNFNFSNAQSDGDDLRFTTSDNSTVLDYEIEYYNATSEQGYIWVEVDSINNASDTEIIMYYGYVNASNGEDVEGTWNSDYVAVWHMTEKDLIDSTSNNNDGTATNILSEDVIDCAIGKCLDLNGSVEYVTVADDPTFTLNDFTFMMYGKTNRVEYDGMVYHKYDATTTDGFYFTVNDNVAGGVWDFTTFVSGTAKVSISDDPPNTYNSVIHNRRESGLMEMMLNTTVQADTETNAGEIDSSQDLLLFNGAGARYFNGSVGEIRFSNVSRSDAWIKAEYNSVATSNFLSIGAEYEQDAVDVIDIVVNSPANESVNQSLSLTLNYTVNSTSSDVMNLSTYFNGSLECSNNSINNGTFTCDVSGLDYETTYDWYVYVTDGTVSDNSTLYQFTTIDTPPDYSLTVVLPTGITEMNISCMQPYQDYVEPNGQDTKQPFYVISRTTGDLTNNITVNVSEALPSYIQLYGSTTPYRIDYDYMTNITHVDSIIIKRLKANTTQDVWIWAKCINATDDVSSSLNLTFGAD